MKNTQFVSISTFTSVLLLSISGSAFQLQEQVRQYEQRYQLTSREQKLVDNQGNGYEALYGVRNFRTVLRGILYRGGANNAYNKHGKRDNQNPLPVEGLKNLCEEGFKSAVYLYSTNFSVAPKAASCDDLNNAKNILGYKQLTALDEKNADIFLKMIYQAIKGEIESPIYMHCWNGWHASGLVSTLALRQFCGLDASQALQYWTQNTDGHSTGYDAIKKRIKEFKPRAQFQITETERQEICLHN